MGNLGDVPTLVYNVVFLLLIANLCFYLSLKYPRHEFAIDETLAKFDDGEGKGGFISFLKSFTLKDIAFALVCLVVIGFVVYVLRQWGYLQIAMYVFVSNVATLVVTYRILVSRFGGPTSLRKILIWLIISLLVANGWLLAPNWIIYNVLFVILCYAASTVFANIRFLYLVIALLAVIVYDIWGVWVSGVIIDMVVTKGMYMPTVALVPIYPWQIVSPIAGMLGSGDVVIPIFALKLATRYKLVRYVLPAYALGLFLAFCIGRIFQTAVPAMITISPLLLIALIGGYYLNYKRGLVSVPLKEALRHG